MKSAASLRKMTGYALAAMVGSLTGIITLIGQKYLSVNLNFLANSASMWVVPAFLVPYCLMINKKQSALLGTVVLIFCVMSYYTFEAVSNHHPYFVNRHQLLWLCCAVIGGVTIGLCGRLARTKAGMIGNVCRNVLPAIFVTEASSKLFHINDYRHMVLGLFLQMSIGLVLYTVINRKDALKRESAISFIVLLVLGNTAFEMLRRFS